MLKINRGIPSSLRSGIDSAQILETVYSRGCVKGRGGHGNRTLKSFASQHKASINNTCCPKYHLACSEGVTIQALGTAAQSKTTQTVAFWATFAGSSRQTVCGANVYPSERVESRDRTILILLYSSWSLTIEFIVYLFVFRLRENQTSAFHCKWKGRLRLSLF